MTCLPIGFSFAGIHCGIKKVAGAPDLALIASSTPCAAAALFTQNRYAAAPVQYDRQVLALHPYGVQAVLVNSGNANAVTGAAGLAAALRSAEAAEAALGLAPGAALVMSTGVIGQPLPVERIEAALPALAQALAANAAAFQGAAQAILTTDTRMKVAAAQGVVGGAMVTVAGMAKGAGMIHPNMATMLAVLATDAALAPDRLQAALRHAADHSFNRISVDGDTSTNDTVLLLANGQALTSWPGRDEKRRREDEGSDSDPAVAFAEFAALLTTVCTELAQAIVRDGEGATKFVAIQVTGLASDISAHRVANAIAISPLVKTAIFGGDANWGRILAAAGNSGVAFAPEQAELWITGGSSAAALLPPLQLVAAGAPLPFSEVESTRRFAQPELLIDLHLGAGPGQAVVWTCDLSYEYVRINGDYRT